jgi:hypothetical protein
MWHMARCQCGLLLLTLEGLVGREVTPLLPAAVRTLNSAAVYAVASIAKYLNFIDENIKNLMIY